MIQRSQHLGRALESRQPLGIAGEGLRQDLDGDLAAELGVSAVHFAHAPSPQLVEDFVLPQAAAGHRGLSHQRRARIR